MRHLPPYRISRHTFPVVFCVLMALLLGLFALAVQPTSAQHPPTAVVTSYALNVRSGPSIAYDIIAQIRHDYVLELLGRNAEATWAQVRLQDGRTGWVNARYIRVVERTPINDLPITHDATPPTGVPVGGRQSVHVVQAGENLFRIALYYGVDLHTLARWNGIENPALIYAGQVLVIPS